MDKKQLEAYMNNPNVNWVLYNILEGESGKINGNVNTGGYNESGANKNGLHSSAYGSQQFIGDTRNTILKDYKIDAWADNLNEQQLASIALMHSNGDLDDVAAGDYSGLNSTNYWEAFTKDFTKLTGAKPAGWEKTYSDLQSNSVHDPEGSWAKVPDAAKEGKKGLFDRKYGGRPGGLDVEEDTNPKAGPEEESTAKPYSPMVGDDYEVPLTPQEENQNKVNEAASLIGKAREFYLSQKNTPISKEDALIVKNALAEYTLEFSKTLPDSGWGSRNSNLGAKTEGYQKEYHEGVLSLMDELTEGLDENTPEGWGQIAAIRRKAFDFSSSEAFAIEVMGDDAGVYGSMDGSMEYIISNRKQFDWGFGSYHDDDKALDHARIPKNIRLELENNAYVKEVSDNVDHPNEIFDASDKADIFKTPVFALDPTDVAKYMAKGLQQGSVYNKDQGNVRQGIVDKIRNHKSEKVVTETGVEDAPETPITPLSIDVDETTSLIKDSVVGSDAITTDGLLSQGQGAEIDLDNQKVVPQKSGESTTKDVEDTRGSEDKEFQKWMIDNPDGNYDEYTKYFDLRGDMSGLGEESFLDKIGGLSSLIGIATGAMGLGEALKDVDIPKDPKLGPAFQQRLAESKRLAQQGLTPSELAKAHNDLDSSYATGIENIVRGSAGNRAQFMAGLGGLDVARQSALMDIAVADAGMQRENQEKYDKMMMVNEKYEAARTSKYDQAKYATELANKEAGAALAGSALSMVNQSIGDRQVNRYNKLKTEQLMRTMGYKPDSNGNSIEKPLGVDAKTGEKVQTSFNFLEGNADFVTKGGLLDDNAKHNAAQSSLLNAAPAINSMFAPPVAPKTPEELAEEADKINAVTTTNSAIQNMGSALTGFGQSTGLINY